MTLTIDVLLTILAERGHAQYVGEPVSQLEHALQTAWLAEQAGLGDALVAAGLLHDVGHLLHELGEDIADHGVDAHHEDVSADALVHLFGAEVTEPIRMHVAAKRYLCATDATYLADLSDASRRSLELQGGPFTRDEVEAFITRPHAGAAVELRRLDDRAKLVDYETPDPAHFRRALERCAVEDAT